MDVERGSSGIRNLKGGLGGGKRGSWNSYGMRAEGLVGAKRKPARGDLYPCSLRDLGNNKQNYNMYKTGLCYKLSN